MRAPGRKTPHEAQQSAEDDLDRRAVVSPYGQADLQGSHGIEEPGDGETNQRLAIPREERRGWIGAMLHGTGFVALIVFLMLMIVVPVLRPKAAKGAIDFLDQLSLQGLVLVDMIYAGADALALAGDSLAETGSLLQTTRETLEATDPLLDSIGQLLGTDAPATLEATQRALEASQGGAAAIDSTLRTLAFLGPLTGVKYDPETSLSDSLAETAQTLDTLPEALRSVEQDLVAVQDQLGLIPQTMASIQEDLDAFAGELGGLSESLNEQAAEWAGSIDQLAHLSEGIQHSSWWLMIALEILLLWNGILSLIVIQRGRELRAEP